MRVNFYAGAGAGKTTTAHWLFAELKRKNFSVEFAREYVKKYTYLGVDPSTLDQKEIFGNQCLEETIPLSGNVKNVISESPILLSYVYAQINGLKELAKEISISCHLFEKFYPSISIYLDRGDKPFKAEGRWGNLESAKQVDEFIFKMLKERHKDSPETLLFTNWEEPEKILEFVIPFLHK